MDLGNALKGYCMMRRQTRPPDLEFRRWFPFVALSFYTWKAGIYWSRVKISKDHIWEHDMENLGKTHYFLKIIPAPMFSDMQWFVMIAKRVLWPLFTIEDSTATANVKRVWRYLMRWEETRLYASRWRIHIPWITFDTALLRNTAERNRSKLPCCSLPKGTFCYQVHEPTSF